MSASEVLSELEAIGAVGDAGTDFAEPAPVAPVLLAVEPQPPAPVAIDQRKVAELKGLCDRLLQVFEVLGRANLDLVRTVEEVKAMVEELHVSEEKESVEDEDSDEPESLISRTVIEEQEVPIDISDFDITPSIPLPPEVMALQDPTETSFQAPIPVAVSDDQLLEKAMRDMGIRT